MDEISNIVNYVEQALIAPIRAIASFFATITIEEVCTDTLEITEHPVEQGASITDHAYVKPSEVSIKIAFDGLFGTPLNQIYQNFLDLQASRIPFNVVTGKRTYQNMLVKTLSQTNDNDTDNILSINVDLQQIILVTTAIVTAKGMSSDKSNLKNKGKNGATENAGTKKPQQADAQKQSALSALAGQ